MNTSRRIKKKNTKKYRIINLFLIFTYQTLLTKYFYLTNRVIIEQYNC